MTVNDIIYTDINLTIPTKISEAKVISGETHHTVHTRHRWSPLKDPIKNHKNDTLI
jgi:hypothetical protein